MRDEIFGNAEEGTGGAKNKADERTGNSNLNLMLKTKSLWIASETNGTPTFFKGLLPELPWLGP